MLADDRQDHRTAGALEVVRHEEELRTRVEAVPYQRVRLSKRIVTETVQIEVELQREQLVVEHLPVDGAQAADAPVPPGRKAPVGRLRASALARLARRSEPAVISAEDVTLELFEERYEVVKRVVSRERVRISREVQTAQAPVSDQLRKEVVDIDQAPADGRAG